MIEEEILDIVRAEADSGNRLNELIDEFRLGRAVVELTLLLSSEHAELVAIGAWILSELPLELYNSKQFTDRLLQLLDHSDPSIRFNSLSALYPALDPQDTGTRSLIQKMQRDPNAGVRMSAEAAAARLFST